MTVLDRGARSFACFGSACTVLVAGADGHELAAADRGLLGWHERFTRFDR